MTFSDDELQMIVDKQIDEIILKSKGKDVYLINIERLIQKKIATDPNLKKQLVTQVLQSGG